VTLPFADQSPAGQSQFLTAPVIAQPNNFNLSLNEPDDFDPSDRDLAEHDSRLAHMLATQVRSNDDENDMESTEDDVVGDKKLSDDEKRQMLQDFLFMAASNGDDARVKRLVRGDAAKYIDVNAVDTEGTPPLVYASCFGHKDVVMSLLNAGAEVDKQDRNQWSALMWAATKTLPRYCWTTEHLPRFNHLLEGLLSILLPRTATCPNI
jgi:hypothetical protein